MALKRMSLEELLEMLKSGRVCNINSYYMEMFIRYLEELKVTRKALELMAEELVSTKNSINRPGRYAKECHSQNWWVEHYLQKAREE
jgi:hypothetical protein